ncbi:MAG: LLM class flavin-dependent oxidoreductase, partial [Planctomycetota bacterium]
LITGGSQQSPDWLARNGDGWMIYPQSAAFQRDVIGEWRDAADAAGAPAKPVMQPLYVDLVDDPKARPQPIHLGYRLNAGDLVTYLRGLQDVGMNHVALNLRFHSSDVEDALRRIATDVLPAFHD